MEIKQNKINHGLLINKRGIKIANKPAHNSKALPELSNFVDKCSQIKLVFSTKCKVSFLLNNHIDPSNINSDDSWMSDIVNNFSLNESNKSPIYLGIIFPQAELTFKDKKPEPLTELQEAVEKALEHHNPYHELLKIFNTYGHFLPKKIILGHKLYRLYYLIMKQHSQNQFTEWDYFEFATYNNKILNLWDNYAKLHNFDTSFLTSVHSNKVMKNDLKEWVDSCLESKQDSCRVINWKELYPLYEIFDEKTQKTN
ncbi:calmodulin-dependent protein kinase [Gigaspora margarita]|uniref:Calmodulin-dependent protein kinase n=1 Tax=Gigaspora margarita TaxID=4874 RepID=A0A8H3XD77_GIGMA|nr:calmodulin-dependent protein kinase [Gigaspora margarita]